MQRILSFETQTISFNSAVMPPTPFMIRIAKTQGSPVRKGKSGVELSAELYKPQGDGPFPIVMLFPTCKGWANMRDGWLLQIVQWGYVAVQIKSIQSRADIGINCDPARYGGIVGGTDILFDGMGTLEFLSQFPYANIDQAAVIGWGLGGSGAVKSVNAHGFARLFERRFKAAVAFYPNCEMHSEYIAPSLVFIGEEDKLARSSLCQIMFDNTAEDQRDLFDLRIVEGAGHEFDQNEAFDLDKLKWIKNQMRIFLRNNIG